MSADCVMVGGFPCYTLVEAFSLCTPAWCDRKGRHACMPVSIIKGFNWLVSLPPHNIFFGLAGKRDMHATVLVQ